MDPSKPFGTGLQPEQTTQGQYWNSLAQPQPQPPMQSNPQSRYYWQEDTIDHSQPTTVQSELSAKPTSRPMPLPSLPTLPPMPSAPVSYYPSTWITRGDHSGSLSNMADFVLAVTVTHRNLTCDHSCPIRLSHTAFARSLFSLSLLFKSIIAYFCLCRFSCRHGATHATTGRPTRGSLRHVLIHGAQPVHGHTSISALTTTTQLATTTVSTKSYAGLARAIACSRTANAGASASTGTNIRTGTFHLATFSSC